MGSCPSDETLTIRAGALFLISGRSRIGEQKAGQIVHREAQFVALGTRLSGALRSAAADAGVVDEEIEPAGRALHRVGEAPHLRKRSKIRHDKLGGTAAGLDLGNDALAALAIAAMHQNPPAGRSEHFRHDAADTIGRAGDKSCFSVRLRHGSAFPFTARCSFLLDAPGAIPIVGRRRCREEIDAIEQGQ